MSKRSLFWNDASGKLGNTVMYRAGGEQRTRQYVAKIKNPKTLAQQTQRISMLNFVTMFKQLKYVIDFGFPQKAGNQSGWNAFVQANKALPKVAITRSMANALDYVPAGVVVSKGDIPLDMNLIMGDIINFMDRDSNPMDGVILPFTKNFQVKKGDIGLAVEPGDNTLSLLNTGDLAYRYLTANGNPNGFPTKFKITVLHGFYQTGSVPEPTAYRLRADQVECYAGSKDVFKTIVSNGSDYALSMGIAYADQLGSDETPNWDNLAGLTITGDAASVAEAPLWAVIISWSENGATRVTNSMVMGLAKNADFVSQFRQDGDVYDQVLEELGVKSEDILATPPISNADANFGFSAVEYDDKA